MMDKLRAGYTLSAKDRYLWFVKKYGPIVDIIPQNEIALYLGIKPQSLSRIRAELAGDGTAASENARNIEKYILEQMVDLDVQFKRIPDLRTVDDLIESGNDLGEAVDKTNNTTVMEVTR